VSALRRFLARCSAFQIALASALFARLVLGWIAVFPLVALASALGAGALDGGDRALFAPSGLLLLELLRRGAAALPSVAESSLLLLVIALAVQTLATAFSFAAFAGGFREPSAAFARARARVPRFLVLGGLELVLTGAAIAFAWLTWSELGPAESGVGSFTALLGIALTLLVVAAIAVVCDLARAASIAGELGLGAALLLGAHTARAHAAELAGSYVLAGGAGALFVALAARAVGWLSVDREGGFRVAGAFALHLTVLALLCAIQALWLRRLGRYATPDSPRAWR
jgi:hypothetical protein